VFAPDGSSMVLDVSSRYAPLHQYYDFDLPTVLGNAPFIDGTVIPITDDVRPLNFCHWLLDWIARLGFLGSRAHRQSTYVVTTPLIAAFQRDSLRMCGFDESRVIALEEFQAVRARELLVPGDLPDVPHPIHKAAPWTLSYLRSTIGLSSMREAGGGRRRGEKIYVSRADGGHRKVVNDVEFAAALARRGYRTITLSDLSLAEQVTAFAYASHIVSMHGAGLANLAFATPGTKAIEIFPESFGTPAFWVVAAGTEYLYATDIADRVMPGAAAPFADVAIDVARFLDACGELL
jgi:capsular polysaccharide biosynthesis protein